MTLTFTFDEEKLREIVNEAVERLKAEGYIWKEDNEDGKQLLGEPSIKSTSNTI
jgi:biotin operon repressor